MHPTVAVLKLHFIWALQPQFISLEAIYLHKQWQQSKIVLLETYRNIRKKQQQICSLDLFLLIVNMLQAKLHYNCLLLIRNFNKNFEFDIRDIDKVIIRIRKLIIFFYCLQNLLNYQIYQKQRQMLDFAFEPINSKEKKCGCYALNPQLLSLYEQHRILVPLKSCDYQMEIVNAMVNVTLVQTYQNPIDKFLEVEYSFPISPSACVYRFVATFGSTRIEGVVKEKEEAKQQYQKAVSEGKKAAYGELNADSKDILNLKVGNIGPKQEVKIEIVYLQELSLGYNTFYQLHLPATITPRYLTSIPQEKVLAGYRKVTAQQTFGTFNWSFQIVLRTTRKVTFYDSHTHKLQAIFQNDTRTQSVFSLENPCVPNKDFVFSYTTENYELPNYVFGRTDKSSTAMLSFIPKFCTLNINDAYNASIEGKTLEGDIDTARAEYIFLLDRSGSMGGTRIEKAKEALVLFIKSLPQDSYFNVVSFGSNSSSLFPESRKYANKDIEYAVKEVKKMSADMGGTEIFNPLFKLLKQKPKDGYPKQVFLLTDGGVSNTEGVLKMVGNSNKFARVHSIGIGNGASESLIVGCAKRGKGCHVFINDQEDPSEKIIQLLSDSLSAVISKMDLEYDANIVQSIIPNPKSMPYILKGQIVNFYITFKGQLTEKANFAFSYEESQNKQPYSTKIEIDPQSANESFIDRMGHFKRIRILQESHASNSQLQDYIFFVKKFDKKQEIIRQSVEHQILSQFTAFICVQKELIDGKYQQIKQTGKVKVFIQSPPPIQYELQEKLCYRAMAVPGSTLMKNLKKRSIFPSKKEMHSQFRSQKMENIICQPINLIEQSKKKSKKIKIEAFRCKQEDRDQQDQDSLIRYEKCEQKSIDFQKSEKKQQLKKEEKKDANLINFIISEQDSEGYWKNLTLLSKLFSSDVQDIVKKEQNPLAAAAYLIAKWIEKNYPQKQYSLIVKKALNYSLKQAKNYQDFPTLFDKYIH